MSTAALASARRRRTTVEPQLASQNVSNKPTQQELQNSIKQAVPPPQSLTPLQILQLHDNKLKDLEALVVELNSEEYITNVVEEKINDLMQLKLSTFSNDLDKLKPQNYDTNSIETKLQMLESTIQTNLTIQTVRFDEFKNGLQDNFTTFKENTIKMIDLLINKETHNSHPNVSIPSSGDSSINVEKLEMLTKEVNELKLLVIKNQTLALETCNSLINMKDDFKLYSEKMAQITDKIGSMNNMYCANEQCDPAQMFLQSFMKNKLFGGANKINMDGNFEDNEEDYGDDNNYDEIINTTKLHIDSNTEEIVLDNEEIVLDNEEINMETNELIIDENQLQEILELNAMEEINLNSTSLAQDMIDEIKNISLVNAKDSLETSAETQLAETQLAETQLAETQLAETQLEVN